MFLVQLQILSFNWLQLSLIIRKQNKQKKSSFWPTVPLYSFLSQTNNAFQTSSTWWCCCVVARRRDWKHFLHSFATELCSPIGQQWTWDDVHSHRKCGTNRGLHTKDYTHFETLHCVAESVVVRTGRVGRWTMGQQELRNFWASFWKIGKEDQQN